MRLTTFLILLLTIYFAGCDNHSPNQSILSSEKPDKCIWPYNPYGNGGGHDAGFNWASETGGGCDGNSDSFNEGCAEYYRQLNQYNRCVSRNRE